MQVLPEGLVVPPPPYLAALAAGAAAVFAALWRLRPPVAGRFVLAATPWMVLGGGVHALEQAGLVPALLRPFAAAPAVYVTTTVVAGAVWAAGAARDGTRRRDGDEPTRDSDGDAAVRWLGGVGAAGAVALAVGVYAVALSRPSTVALAWPVAGVVGAAAVAAPVYYLLATYRRETVERVGAGGGVVVFAHALDGVSTAIGVDLLGTGERSPLPRAIMDVAGRLPTAEYVGTGWLFVLVKLAVAAGIVLLLADYVAEEPAEGNLLVTVVAAVGMGPAANNLTLFLLSGGV